MPDLLLELPYATSPHGPVAPERPPSTPNGRVERTHEAKENHKADTPAISGLCIAPLAGTENYISRG